MKAIVIILSLLCISSVQARHHHRSRPAPAPGWFALGVDWGVKPLFEVHTPANDARGAVRARSGASAKVAASALGRFQCVVDALEAQGYPVRFMGGWRARGSVRGSLHPAGLALDINQVRRNVTMPHMPSNEVALANRCGVISGAQWRRGDSGHFQVGGWSGRH